MSNLPIVADNNAINEANLSLMERFFKIPVSTLKTGNFGYTNEIVSNVAKTGIFHRSMLFNEMFLNTASLPSSITNFANQYNYVIPDATPSKCSITLALDFQTVKNYTSANFGTLIINRKDSFNIGGFIFSLPYSVEIKVSGNSVLCRYLLTEQPVTPEIQFNYRTNPYIKTWIQIIPDNNIEKQFLFLLLELYQYEYIEKSWEVMNTNISEQILYSFNYVDQLVNFNVKYNPVATSSSSTDKYIPKFSDPTIIPEDPEYVYYDKVSDNEVQIFFSVLEQRFKPKFGSKVTVEIFTSRGIASNFEYSGDIQFAFSQVGLEKEPVVARMIINPSGGRNAQSLVEVKQTLLHYQRTKDTLITDYDIQSYFDTIAKQMLSNRAKVRFLKTRDDFISRIYSAFLLVADDENQVIPTNTVNFKIPFSSLEERDFKLKQGTLFIYDTNLNTVRMLRDDESPEHFLFNQNSFIYALPYYMEVRFSPFTRVAYYDMFIDSVYSLFYTPVEAARVNREFLLNEITIKRNPVVDNFYKLSCNLAVSGTAVNLTQDISVVCIIKTNGVPLGYFKLNYDPTSLLFIADLPVDDDFSLTNKLILRGVKNINTGSDFIEITDKVDLEIGVFFNHNNMGYTEGLFSNLVSDTSLGLDTKTQVITLRSTVPVSFYNDLNNLVQSDIFINENNSIDMMDIPLVGAGYYFDSKKLSYLMSNIQKYMQTLKDSLTRLGNNTAVNLKFFNSYGVSRLYNTTTVNITLDLSIKLSSSFTSDLDKNIKKAIRDFVINSNESPNRRLVMSNLISFLETRFIEIDYVIFNSLNGLNSQSINYLYDITDDVNEQLVSTPEYLSISVNQSTVIRPQDSTALTIRYI